MFQRSIKHVYTDLFTTLHFSYKYVLFVLGLPTRDGFGGGFGGGGDDSQTIFRTTFFFDHSPILSHAHITWSCWGGGIIRPHVHLLPPEKPKNPGNFAIFGPLGGCIPPIPPCIRPCSQPLEGIIYNLGAALILYSDFNV